MARTVLFFALLFFVNSAYTQSLNWQWAKQYGGTGRDFGGRTAVDAAGNVYMVGIFTGAINIGSQALTSSGEADVFISKMDANGVLIWAKRYGGSGDEYAESIVLTTDNIYISGTYKGPSNLGSQTPSSSERVFLTKLTIDGDLLWSKFDVGARSNSFGSMAIDNAHNILLGGLYSTNLVFGSDSLKTTSARTNPFLAKIDSTGNLLWMKSPITSDYSGILDVTTDASNNVYVTGAYGGSILFGGHNLSGGTIFTVKYSAIGDVIWARDVKTDYGQGHGLAVDNAGNVFVTGRYQDTADFDGTIIVGASPSNFLAKYDSAGTMLWAKHIAKSTFTSTSRVVVNSQNEVFVNGVFSNFIMFGGTAHTTSRNKSPYILKLDGNGNFVWGAVMSGGTQYSPHHISLGIGDEVYLSGAMQDSLQCGSTKLYGAGEDDIFLAKLSSMPNAVKMLTQHEAIKLYPQPSTGQLKIEFQPKSFHQLIISDQLGRSVFQQEILMNDLALNLNLAHLPTGIYNARFIGDQSISRKIIIAR